MTATNATFSEEQIELFGNVNAPTQSDARALSGELTAGEKNQVLWADAVDTMLGWLSTPDEIDMACHKSAIDFAQDQIEIGAEAPSSILATEDGEITFEWRWGNLLYCVTIIDSGLAEYTKMQDFKVVEKGLLRRDPKTRKLQFESQ